MIDDKEVTKAKRHFDAPCRPEGYYDWEMGKILSRAIEEIEQERNDLRIMRESDLVDGMGWKPKCDDLEKKLAESEQIRERVVSDFQGLMTEEKERHAKEIKRTRILYVCGICAGETPKIAITPRVTEQGEEPKP